MMSQGSATLFWSFWAGRISGFCLGNVGSETPAFALRVRKRLHQMEQGLQPGALGQELKETETEDTEHIVKR